MQLWSPGGSSLAAAVTPWPAAAAVSSLLLQQHQQHSDSGGGTSLAMAVQHHLLLASTAKAGPEPSGAAGSAVAPQVPSDKENGAQQARQLTLTAGKVTPAAAAPGGSPIKQLTSSNVRMRLHALLDTA